ncbi:MAG: hypothetical protein Q9195_002827 [Heterodermia aff. obscurata]
MPPAPRRTHRKSRAGCFACKKRRVKCNEQGPPCSQCAKRQIACVYPEPDRLGAPAVQSNEEEDTSLSRASSMTPSNDHQSRRLLELELMHQWTTNTYKSFCGESKPDYPIWQVSLPVKGLKHEFLLNGFLSMAALEIALTRELSGDSKYGNTALEYYDSASSTFREEITDITPEKQEIVLAFSLIAMVLGLALPQLLKARGEQPRMVEHMLVHSEMLKGVRLISSQHGGQIRKAPILRSQKAFEDVPKGPIDPGTEAAIARLNALNDQRHDLSTEPSTAPTAAEHAICQKAIRYLEESFARCQDPIHKGHALAWLRLAGEDFVEALKDGNSVALIALMHWGVLVERCSEGFWWAQSVGKNLVDEIADLLAADEDLTLASSISWARAERAAQRNTVFKMFSNLVLSLILSLCTVVATCVPTSKIINWFPCEQNGTLPFTCGTLIVPFDYTDPASNTTLTLDLVKVNATKQPARGSILFNPGGPGEPGRDFVVQLADSLLVYTGGVYDLIGFDTRGTESTIPFSCYDNATARAFSTVKTPIFLNSSDTAIGESWAAKTTIADSCYEKNKHIGELIGTGFVARDMMQIVDALNEDGLLRYWGLSYGSVLGETVAAMYPDRMDKIVLDGVLNPRNYYRGYDLQQLVDTDKTWDEFFKGCVASPQGCALAQHGSTPEELKNKIYALLWQFKYQPVAAGTDIVADIIDYNLIKQAISAAIYNPSFWPPLAAAFHGLLTGNLTTLFALEVTLAQPPIFPNHGPEAGLGIRASDVSLRTKNLNTLYPLIRKSFGLSQLLGDYLVSPALHYAQWRFKAKGAYEGSFCDIKTRNPILFIGNTFDPLTPLISARNASASFPGSVVLEHGGHGHTSLAQPSLCTAKVIRAYFVNGTLPAPETKCETVFPLFSNGTVGEALGPLVNETLMKRSVEDGDVELGAAMAALSSRVPRLRV